jgi:hypothetical protein
MGSLFSMLDNEINDVDTLHDCKTWVRVPLPAPCLGGVPSIITVYVATDFIEN